MPSSIYVPDMIDENPNGIFAAHPNRAMLPVIVAPTTDARSAAHNTIRKDFVVVACANLKEYNFAFDSSVVEPRARDGFIALARLLARYPKCPMSLFGHADPTGEETYNKWLSERRARAIYAVMIRDPDIWEQLYRDQQGAPGDNWGLRSLQLMLDGMGFMPGNYDGKMDDRTRDAIRECLGLPPLAPVGNTAAIRKAIFERYMDWLRTDPVGKVTFPGLGPDDFLGGAKQKATLQGCSEFNPQYLLGRVELKGMEAGGDEGKAARNAAFEPDRRVVIYLFAQGTKIDPKKWPCPAAAQGIQGCIDRLWSNGNDRRKKLFENHRRRFGRSVKPERRELVPPNPLVAETLGNEETTFGCRFYHGVAVHSPCERDIKMWVLQLLVDSVKVVKPSGSSKSAEKVPLANRRFAATIGTSPDAPVIRGRTTINGVIGLPYFDDHVAILLKVDAYADLGLAKPPNTSTDSQAEAAERDFVTIKLDAGELKRLRVRGPDDVGYDADFDLEEPPPTEDEVHLAALQRLYNLGYGPDDTGGREFGNWDDKDREAAFSQFQRDHPPLKVTGKLDPDTRRVLFDEYGG